LVTTKKELIMAGKEALFYSKESNGIVHCGLCPHHCRIKPGEVGTCGVRRNDGGTLVSLVYGLTVAENVDPIEKKPLFHFLPGTTSFSIATAGCNLHCRHCQNADISQMPRDAGRIAGRPLAPEEAVRRALKAGCASISYTYTEPTIFYEYAFDTAVLAKKAGLKNVFVTNGYTAAEPLRAIAPYLDAANVDLKSFSDAFYKKICGARLQPVLDTLKLYHELGIWLEVTTLVIPGENDSDEDLGGCARFVAAELGRDVPWHVSGFRPTYLLTERPATPPSTLRRARRIGLEAGLKFVYEGNIPGEGEDTVCPGCGKTVIARYGYTVRENRLRGGRCPDCEAAVPGVWA
jgi:pyruvate formate lyase activating enzyme